MRGRVAERMLRERAQEAARGGSCWAGAGDGGKVERADKGGGAEAKTSETENSGEMTQRVCRQRRAGGRDATAAGRE